MASRLKLCLRSVDVHGMQGTNAHVIIETAGAGDATAASVFTQRPGGYVWRRTAYWFAPRPHPLLFRTSPTPGAAAVSASVNVWCRERNPEFLVWRA